MDVWRRILVSLCLLIGISPLLAASRPQIVCYGDSITAGHGLNAGQAYPDALQRDLDQRGYSYQVSNMGTSGATTKDAVVNVGAVIKAHPAVVIVEFGGNDGLRGLPLEQTRKNLDAVLMALDGAHIKVLLAGITLPGNMVRVFWPLTRVVVAGSKIAAGAPPVPDFEKSPDRSSTVGMVDVIRPTPC